MSEEYHTNLNPEDRERVDFLKRLDNAVRIQVTDWEAGLIESFLTDPRPMTQAQRGAVDQMREEYEGQL